MVVLLTNNLVLQSYVTVFLVVVGLGAKADLESGIWVWQVNG